MEKHESKHPCLIVLDLEVICCGKELFLSKKSTYYCLVCSLCSGTVPPPHPYPLPTILLCEGPSQKCCLSFDLLVSLIPSIDCFLALIVSAKLSVNQTIPCHDFERKMPSLSTLQQPVWWMFLLHLEVHFYAFHML